MVRPFTKQLLIVVFWVVFLSGYTVFAQQANLGDLSVRFCNDDSLAWGSNALSLQAKGGVEEDICLYLSNGWATPITMKINFVDGTVTNDTEQKKACQPESSTERFGKFISIAQTDYLIQPEQTLEVHATANFPTSYAWMAYGCVTYQAVGEWGGGDSMFNVLTRKANFIDILVEGKIEMWVSIVDHARSDNLSNSPQLLIYKDSTDGSYKAQLQVNNVWNVAQQVDVKWEVTARFQSTPILAQTKKVLPWDSIDFLFTLDPALPRYEWVIKMDLEVTHTPVFEFESDQITDEMRKPLTQTISARMLLAPWKLLAWVIALLLIVFALSRRRKYKPHSAHHPHTPPHHKHPPHSHPQEQQQEE